MSRWNSGIAGAGVRTGTRIATLLRRSSRTAGASRIAASAIRTGRIGAEIGSRTATDRKSTRLNSSHANISYAVFCLKKKNRYKNLKKAQSTTTIQYRHNY